MDDYNPKTIEQSAQKTWNRQAGNQQTGNQQTGNQQTVKQVKTEKKQSKKRFYCLSMMPYPSGNLHMGHVRNYTIGDVITAYQKALGYDVLQPMSWDAFGLPAENAAMQHKLAASTWTQDNIKRMRKQFEKLGYKIDWNHSFATCEPSYYRWEQWLFLQLYKKGLAYQKDAWVNWDPVDQTVLANEQVIDGKGWRSGAQIERKKISQWFLKISAYADELLDSLDTLDGWPEQVKQMQRNWIGKSHGTTINFAVEGEAKPIEVYTTRADTLMGVSYLAVACNHPLASKASQKNPALASLIESMQHCQVNEASLATMPKKGVDTGYYAIHPLSGEKLPIWAANYVLMDYGSAAVMAVPAHDSRDHEFAKLYNLPIRQVIEPGDNKTWDINKQPYLERGKLIHSMSFNGLDSKTAEQKITQALIKAKKGQAKTQYRLRDWGVSRQRYWGTPIPIIYCQDCHAVPVPEKDLPVILPEKVSFKEDGQSPLKQMPQFVDTTCPICQKPAKRETDTFDTFVDSSWYHARLICPKENNAILNQNVNDWLPVDQYIGGIEHATMHLLYARFIHKVLRDLNLLSSDEPFKRLLSQGMVLSKGAKMSKSKGNTVSPEPLIESYGADAVRLFMMFAAPPEQDLEWSDAGLQGADRFLKKLWNFAKNHQASIINVTEGKTSTDNTSQITKQQASTRQNLHAILQQANQDMHKQQFNTVVSAAMKIFNLISQLNDKNNDAILMQEGLSILLRLLAPITPHICHCLWHDLGFKGHIENATWPQVDQTALILDEITWVVQINGKRRSDMQASPESDQETLFALAKQKPELQKYLSHAKPKKIIVVPKRLINIIV
jgi:leucyl-tRNA synthetase